MPSLITILLRCFGFLGLRVGRISNALSHKRIRYLNELGVNVVLDVGANTGQYANELRRLGYEGKLISFEPLSEPFRQLQRYSGETRNHECWQLALGRSDGEAEVNVSENIVSSSLSEVRDESVRACPSSRRVGSETVQVSRLDSLRARILSPTDRVHLKIDTQGTEADVLLGATETLDQTVSVEIELSLTPLYNNQLLLAQMFEVLRLRDFKCVWLERGFTDEISGYMLQVDGYFIRNSLMTQDAAGSHSR
jgi:FkbM family methyltransferase